jgi:hypothetical protein
MSVWNKVLLGFILFFSLLMFYMATQVLGHQRKLRSPIPQLEQQIATLTESNRELGETVSALRVQVSKITSGRGKVWVGNHDQVNPQDGQVKVLMAAPHNLDVQAILFVFETVPPALDGQGNPAGGKYLGEFRVVQVENETNVVIEPAHRFLKWQADALINSQPQLTLYETMPKDREWLFEGATEEQLAGIFPPKTLRELLHHGQNAEAGDPEEFVKVSEDGQRIYRRPIHDYEGLFREMDRLRALSLESIGRMTSYNAANASASDLMQKEVEAINRDNEEAKAELDVSNRELALVTQVRDSLRGKLSAAVENRNGLLAENRRLSAEWTQLQLQKAEELERALASGR